MDFVVKLGETGLAFPYTNIPFTERVAFLQEKIQADTHIDVKDQILFTKKGHKLHGDDVFSTLEKENNFQATVTRLENMAKSVFTIYVFDQKKINADHKNSTRDRAQPYFMESNEELRDYLASANIIDKDYTSSFQSQITDASVTDTIKRANPTIIDLDNKVFGTYLRIKKKFLQYKTKARKAERLIKESENQLQTFDVLLKHASINYNPCKNKKNEVYKRFLQNQEKNNVTLKKFEESLENLKKIELHDSLKTEKQKCLLDIYFSPEAMYRWRNGCVEFQNNIKAKIDRYSGVIKNIKKKLKDERDQTINLVLGQFHNQASGVDSAAQEGEACVLNIFKKCYEEYRSIRETLESVAQSPSSEEEEEKLKSDHWKSLEEKNWEEEMAICDENIQKMDKILEQILKMKQNFETQIFSFYKFIMKCSSELHTVANEKMKHLSEELDKLEKEFSYLLNPSHLPGAYQSSLAEVSRRREFALTFERKLRKLQTFTENEKELRKKFLAQYGRILPCEFIPQLKHMPPIISVENADTDNTLPKIDGFHKLENPQGNDSAKKEKRQIEELERANHDLRQELQKLQSDGDLKKRLEEMTQDFHNERERTKALKIKLNELEKQKLAKSLQKENYRDNASKEMEIQSLRDDFEQLSKLSSGVLSSLENYSDFNSQSGSMKSGKENSSQLSNSEKNLSQKVTVLSGLVQQVTKSSFDIFCKKLGEKQKKFDDARMKYENLLMKSQEDLQRQGTQLTAHYEERLHELNQKYNDMQRKMRDVHDELKKSQDLLAEQKNEYLEKSKNHQLEIEQIRKDVKVKSDMLKSKDDMIKVLSEGKNAHIKQIAEFKDKMEQFEKKIKLEHSEVLTNIHNLHKQDIEKLKEKIKSLETKTGNKEIELEKAKSLLTNEQKETKIKDEIIRKLETELDSLKEELEKAQNELKGYQNKIENMDIVIKSKTVELEEKEKKLQDLISEKKTMNDDLLAYKQFNSELNKNLLELKKKKEAEKNVLKEENEKLLHEIEKKKVEITNLKEQIEKIDQETKSKAEAISKLSENQNAEKVKIASVTEELNNKNIELNALKTKHDLFSLDLENKVKENIILSQKLESFKLENDKLSNDLQTSSDALAAERNTTRDLKNRLEDARKAYEKLKAESDVKMKQYEELEQTINELNAKISKGKENLDKIKKEYENLIKQTNEKEQQEESINLELNQQIALLKDEIASKSSEIEELVTEKEETQLELSKLKEQNDSYARNLQENTETINSLKEDIQNNQNITNEMQKQQACYEEEIKNKQQEVDKLRDGSEILNQQLEKINGDYRILTGELEANRESANAALVEYKDTLRSKLDYLRLEKGTKVLFIPYSSGIYVPFTLRQYTNKEIESILKNGTANLGSDIFNNIEKSVKSDFFLDLDGLSQAYQDILRNFSLLIVGTVKDIKKKLNTEINPDHESNMVEIEKIDYMMGFDDEEEMLLKNYVE